MIWNSLDIIIILKIYVCFNCYIKVYVMSQWGVINVLCKKFSPDVRKIKPRKTRSIVIMTRNWTSTKTIIISMINLDWLCKWVNKHLRSVGPQLEGGARYGVRGTQWMKCEITNLLVRESVFSSFFLHSPSPCLSFSLYLFPPFHGRPLFMYHCSYPTSWWQHHLKLKKINIIFILPRASHDRWY